MNKSRIVELREQRGWTQERLASASRVGLRTIQRLESGQDASLETLSLVAEALRVPVRELFTSIDDELNDRVESLHARTENQQAARNRIESAWRWLYLGVGMVVTLVSFTLGSSGFILFLAYWTGGFVILRSVQTIYLEPHLDARYPLSFSKRHLRSVRKSGHARGQAAPIDSAATPSADRVARVSSAP